MSSISECQNLNVHFNAWTLSTWAQLWLLLELGKKTVVISFLSLLYYYFDFQIKQTK